LQSNLRRELLGVPKFVISNHAHPSRGRTMQPEPLFLPYRTAVFVQWRRSETRTAASWALRVWSGAAGQGAFRVAILRILFDRGPSSDLSRRGILCHRVVCCGSAQRSSAKPPMRLPAIFLSAFCFSSSEWNSWAQGVPQHAVLLPLAPAHLLSSVRSGSRSVASRADGWKKISRTSPDARHGLWRLPCAPRPSASSHIDRFDDRETADHVPWPRCMDRQ